MPRIRALNLALAVCTLNGLPLAAQQQVAAPDTPPGRPVLVELFTSEGCSSCPPADDLLRRVNGRRSAGGQLIVGLSEHVTYWNRLGWADPFSAQAFTDRQGAYADRFGLDGVYTPQMVIDGREQIVGGDPGALADALEKERRAAGVDLRILSIQRDRNDLLVRFTAGGLAVPPQTEIMAVVADDADRSDVARGENRGRRLEHVAVARSITRLGALAGPGEQTARLPVPPRSAEVRNGGQSLVLFLQAANLGPVLGAAVQPIP